jgi:hypothetical protein
MLNFLMMLMSDFCACSASGDKMLDIVFDSSKPLSLSA